MNENKILLIICCVGAFTMGGGISALRTTFNTIGGGISALRTTFNTMDDRISALRTTFNTIDNTQSQ